MGTGSKQRRVRRRRRAFQPRFLLQELIFAHGPYLPVHASEKISCAERIGFLSEESEAPSAKFCRSWKQSTTEGAASAVRATQEGALQRAGSCRPCRAAKPSSRKRRSLPALNSGRDALRATEAEGPISCRHFQSLERCTLIRGSANHGRERSNSGCSIARAARLGGPPGGSLSRPRACQLQHRVPAFADAASRLHRTSRTVLWHQ